MFLYPNRESRTKDPLGVKMMKRRVNKNLYSASGLCVNPNATYQIELPSGQAVSFETLHEAERFKRRAYQSGNRMAECWTVDTVHRASIDLRRSLRNPPTNPATYAAKGIEL